MAISFAELKELAENAFTDAIESEATKRSLQGVDRLEHDIAQRLKLNATQLGREQFLKNGELRYHVWAEDLYPLALFAEAAARFTDFNVTIVAEMRNAQEFEEATAIFRSRL